MTNLALDDPRQRRGEGTIKRTVALLKQLRHQIAQTGLHKHKCDQCGTVWTHDNECQGSPRAHSCPQCGKQQREWYDGEDPPTFQTDCRTKQHAAIKATREE